MSTIMFANVLNVHYYEQYVNVGAKSCPPNPLPENRWQGVYFDVPVISRDMRIRVASLKTIW
jgi:hypothetical protein